MAYDRVNWINEEQGTATPLNAENLNKMDLGIADVDERVTALEEGQGGDLTERVNKLESDNSKNKADIAVNAIDISSLDTRVTDLENQPPAQTDAYKTVKVGTNELVAIGADTVEFVAGSNVNISADATTKQITISATGGGGGGGDVYFNDIKDKPTNLSGYGITDAYTKIEVDGKVGSWTDAVEVTATGEQSVIFTGLDLTKGYKLWFGTSDGSQIGIKSSLLVGTTLTYVVNIPDECPVPITFKLKVIDM